MALTLGVRRGIAWLCLSIGWAWYIVHPGRLRIENHWGPDTLPWRFLFCCVLFWCLLSWYTNSRWIFNFYFSLVLTLGSFRVWFTWDLGFPGPIATWLVIWGAHLMAWAHSAPDNGRRHGAR